MEKDAFYNITRKEKVQIESAMNPLIITDAKEPDFQFYDISSPFVVMLETCRESDNNCHIYQFSPDNYHNIELGLSSNFALLPAPSTNIPVLSLCTFFPVLLPIMSGTRFLHTKPDNVVS